MHLVEKQLLGGSNAHWHGSAIPAVHLWCRTTVSLLKQHVRSRWTAVLYTNMVFPLLQADDADGTPHQLGSKMDTYL